MEGGSNAGQVEAVDPATDEAADTALPSSLLGDKLAQENITKPCQFPWAVRPHAASGVPA